MSTKAPVSNSVGRQDRSAPEPAGTDSTGLIIAAIAVVAAVATAYLCKGKPELLSILALAATVIGFVAAFLYTRSRASVETTREDPAAGLKQTIDSNRTEYAERLAELRKSLESIKNNRPHTDTGVVRDEIAKLRTEVAGLRSTVSGR